MGKSGRRHSRKILIAFTVVLAGAAGLFNVLDRPLDQPSTSVSFMASQATQAPDDNRDAGARATQLARAIAGKIKTLETDANEETAKLQAQIALAKEALAEALTRAEQKHRWAARALPVAVPDDIAAIERETDPVIPAAPDVVAALAPEQVPVPAKRPEAPTRSTVAAAKTETSSQAMAYAAVGDPTEDDNSPFSGLSKIFSKGKVTKPGPGSRIAVYDISAATVHMPDGTKLEAHSGIGKMLDNPKYVKVRNKGPTPPNIYTLRMRERRFHGVEAIRMTPVDKSAMFGRDGMLTHTNLLRGRIGSHGCVAFTDYDKFLNAFKAGKVTKLIVVKEMADLPVYMAAL